MSIVNENEAEARYSSSTDSSMINEAVVVRGKKKGTSNLETLMHIIKANIGKFEACFE
jgi:hypothetical protein